MKRYETGMFFYLKKMHGVGDANVQNLTVMSTNKYLEFTSIKDTYTSRKEENSFVF